MPKRTKEREPGPRDQPPPIPPTIISAAQCPRCLQRHAMVSHLRDGFYWCGWCANTWGVTADEFERTMHPGKSFLQAVEAVVGRAEHCAGSSRDGRSYWCSPNGRAFRLQGTSGRGRDSLQNEHTDPACDLRMTGRQKRFGQFLFEKHLDRT